MVDFGGMKDKAQGFLSEHEAQVKQGIGKVGNFVGGKIGHDKVDGVEEKLTGLVDKLAAKPGQAPAAPPETPAAPPETPTAPPETPAQ